MDKNVRQWLKERDISEVEVFIPDLSGILRGKIIPCDKFILSAVRMPESAIAQTVNRRLGGAGRIFGRNRRRHAVASGCRRLFCRALGEGADRQIICDCVSNKGSLIRYAPRSVLKRVIRFYQQESLTPIVAPELEFYLARRDNNPDNPLSPPDGRTGRPEFSSQPFSIDAVNEFEPVIEDIYRFAETQGLAVDTLIHEEGVAQFEINFKHDDALIMADQVVMFKRCVREAAIKNGIVATFMAKPVEGRPGSSMHVHQSVISRTTGKHLFTRVKDGFSSAFASYIGGLQHYLPEISAMLIPNINSFRRINTPWPTVNNHWGVNNRTVGLRVPEISQILPPCEWKTASAAPTPTLTWPSPLRYWPVLWE